MSQKKCIFLLILCFGLITGCRNQLKLSPKEGVHMVESYIASSSEHKLLKDAQFDGTLKSGKIQVSYQAGLQAQADCIANLTDKAFSHIQKSTGFQTSYDSFTIYLLQTDVILWDVCEIVTTLDNSYGVILLVRNEEDSCESIISQNSAFHSAFFHEIIDGSLLFRQEGVTMLCFPWLLYMRSSGTPILLRFMEKPPRRATNDQFVLMIHEVYN